VYRVHRHVSHYLFVFIRVLFIIDVCKYVYKQVFINAVFNSF
jgi:hypothetical protein